MEVRYGTRGGGYFLGLGTGPEQPFHKGGVQFLWTVPQQFSMYCLEPFTVECLW